MTKSAGCLTPLTFRAHVRMTAQSLNGFRMEPRGTLRAPRRYFLLLRALSVGSMFNFPQRGAGDYCLPQELPLP